MGSVNQWMLDKENYQKKWTVDKQLINKKIEDRKVLGKKESSILRAMQNGKQAARYGSEKPTIKSMIIRKGYSLEEAQAYLESYEKAAGSDEEQRLRKAKRAGAQAALLGFNCPSYHQLKRKKYSDVDIEAYFTVFKRVAGTQEQQLERRIRLSGYQSAKYGCRRPSKNKLIKKGYNEEQIQIFYDAYDKTAGEKEQQLIRKVKREAYQMARLKVARPRENYLLKKGLNNSLIDLFYSVFDRTTESLFLTNN